MIVNEAYQRHADLKRLELVNILLGDCVVTTLHLLQHDRGLVFERRTLTGGYVSVVDPNSGAERKIGLK